MRAGLVYSINSQSDIVIESGIITQNKMQNPKDMINLLSFKNRTNSYAILSKSFASTYIRALEDNIKEIDGIANISF